GGSGDKVRLGGEGGARGTPLFHALRALRHLLLPWIESAARAALAESEELALTFGRFYFSSASMAAWEIASSTSLAAPLHAIEPMVLPSTLIGSPPRLGNPSGKTSTARF